ncbi:hypothetical protein AB1Y20_001736 [Prymnesium parvum]|uniref:Uncharacterized protein n=1 Tax=Prymnesium parvum TaxID=97485 RepID=A0AB34K9H6_PRYPA
MVSAGAPHQQAVAVLELGEAEGKVGLVGEGEAATVEVVAAAMMERVADWAEAKVEVGDKAAMKEGKEVDVEVYKAVALVATAATAAEEMSKHGIR